MATISEIRELMKQPTRFDLMRQELKTPGVLAKYDKMKEDESKKNSQEEEKRHKQESDEVKQKEHFENMTGEIKELKSQLELKTKEHDDLKKQLEPEENKEEGAIKKLLSKFLNATE